MSLTRYQLNGLHRLADLEAQYARIGIKQFAAAHIGQQSARALRQIGDGNWLKIEKRAVNDFRYQLTDAGRELVRK